MKSLPVVAEEIVIQNSSTKYGSLLVSTGAVSCYPSSMNQVFTIVTG